MATLPHPTRVLKLSQRLTATAITLVLVVTNLALCAGWQSTPEERMACCMKGEDCPMHHSTGPDAAISQAQADSCCASSSARASASVDGPSVVIPGMTPVAIVASDSSAHPSSLQSQRVLVSPLASHVPKHLLHSVLLV